MKTASELIQDRFGVKTSYHEQPEITQLETTITKSLSYNPNRLGLVFVNTGGNNVYLAPSRDVSVGQGILLTANGGSMSMNILEDFELVNMEWFGIADGAASTCYVVEVVSVI
jgi:hypothetical protein